MNKILKVYCAYFCILSDFVILKAYILILLFFRAYLIINDMFITQFENLT